MLLGAHVNNAHPLQEAELRKAETVQMFASNPQSWKKPLPAPTQKSSKPRRFRSTFTLRTWSMWCHPTTGCAFPVGRSSPRLWRRPKSLAPRA